MKGHWAADDRLGIVKPGVDAHVLGILSAAQLLEDCGCSVVVAPEAVHRACERPEGNAEWALIEAWIRRGGITQLGFSYRLDPETGADLFRRLALQAARRGLNLRALHFAGLPETCRLVRDRVPQACCLFDGDETPEETLEKLGIRAAALPKEAGKALSYDGDRLAFGAELVRGGRYASSPRPPAGGYPAYGTAEDGLLPRLAGAARQGGLPILRAHMGPYLPDRDGAVRLFLEWTRKLAASGSLDVLSIGTSQLTQERFGEDWAEAPNGGGVPLNSPGEFAAAWAAARPMLVRTYAGVRNHAALARMYDETIHNAWHALSLWWFCRIDGRGPLSLRENLEGQWEALRGVASRGGAYEPNVPHHFAFRGADDATYVASAYLAAVSAKSLGIRTLVAQVMLNTPKYSWGVQDLAKARALLRMLRRLEDGRFRVILQPRAGLDFLSADPQRAKAQLAAVTALMDDIEPRDPSSPPVIHVVSWSEGSRLADPEVIGESAAITRHALREWRRLRAAGLVDDMAESAEVKAREEALLSESAAVAGAALAAAGGSPGPQALYRLFAAGFLPVPYLWECREELAGAAQWRTRLIRGAVRLVDDRGDPLSVEERIAAARSRMARLGP